MISDFIKKLQDGSDRSKEKILWSVVVVSVVMSLAIWSLSFESYRAVFNQPLDNGMMEGLKASVSTELIDTNAAYEHLNIQTSKQTTDDVTEIVNNEIVDNVDAINNEGGRKGAPLQTIQPSLKATAGTAVGKQYNRLPVDEN
ncbi:hypothetical protein D4R87_02765 [bacterium]|nr:MAG: hypothetical protein D4R87_02765 [bacterium]